MGFPGGSAGKERSKSAGFCSNSYILKRPKWRKEGLFSLNIHSVSEFDRVYVPYFIAQDHVSNWEISLGNFDKS